MGGWIKWNPFEDDVLKLILFTLRFTLRDQEEKVRLLKVAMITFWLWVKYLCIKYGSL